MVQSAPETGECSQTGHEEGRVDWPEKTSARVAYLGRSAYKPTVLAYGCLAAGKAEGIDGELAADGASQLCRQFVLGEGAGRAVSSSAGEDTASGTNLASSIWAGVREAIMGGLTTRTCGRSRDVECGCRMDRIGRTGRARKEKRERTARTSLEIPRGEWC